MEQLINECIVACEDCLTGCLKMNNSNCIAECMVCERICKTLKVALKCKINPELLKCLKKSCKLACEDCSKTCKLNKMECCSYCIEKCDKLARSLENTNRIHGHTLKMLNMHSYLMHGGFQVVLAQTRPGPGRN